MSNSAHLRLLAARKQLLIAESDLNRQLLATELSGLKTFVGKAKKAAMLGSLAVPIVLLVARLIRGPRRDRSGGLKGILESATRGFELARAMEPLWKQFWAGVHRAPRD